MTTAFVLGGGGVLGAHEVGMLRALSEAGIRPDVVVGTSVGAINGVFVAADQAGAAARLGQLWQGDALQQAFSENLWGRAARLARSGTHLHSMEPLRQMLASMLPGSDFADLELPFHCVAASIERASARWFSSGPIVPAVLASCAVPGLLPPLRSAASITSMAVSSTPSRSGGPSPWAPAPSTSCMSAGSSGRWPCLAGRGRWAWSPSRSPAGTGSTRRCRRCPTTSACMSCRPGQISGRRSVPAALPRQD